MKRKTMLLSAAALSVLAFAVLPSMASASHVPWTSGLTGEPGFIGAASTEVWFPKNMTCASTGEVPTITVAGKFETPDTGSVKFLFHNCRDMSLGTKCTTAGQSTGTIETTTLKFHLVYLEPKEGGETHERPGILITSNEGHFATFSCAGGLIKFVIGGNGILGTVTNPKVGESSHSFTIKVAVTEAEGQEHTTTHTTGTKYGTTVSVNGGAAEPALVRTGEFTSTFNEAGVEGTTTTQTP